MTKDEALMMALETLRKAKRQILHAGVTPHGCINDALRALIEALAQPEHIEDLLDMVAAEREACAVICDNRVLYTGYDCAAAIRSRDVYKFGWPIGDPRDILKSAKPRSQS